MKKYRDNQKGFTLVEMIVVIVIFAFVSAILLFRYSDFSTAITLRNLSQEVALSIRKAQMLATSVRGSNPNDAFDATKGYGIYFLTSETEAQSGGSTSFILFRDEDGDGLYDENSQTCNTPTIGNECLEKFTITTGDRIYRICTPSGCTTTPNTILYFRRPNPDARIYTSSAPSTLLSWVDIQLLSRRGVNTVLSPDGETALDNNPSFLKTVRVWNTGQIGVLP